MASNPAPAPAKIKFGTSGWRALIADEFTFANVRRVTEAIAAHVLSKSRRPTLIVGYDPRFFSEEFARTACSVLRAHRIGVLLCGEPTPTPAIAYEILRRKTDGAINFTASHNPAEYHGLKFSGADGGPALPEVTKDIEARCERIAPSGGAPGPHDTLEGVEPMDARPAYLARLAELIRFDAIAKAKLKVACDPLHGCGAGYLDRALADHGIAVTAVRTSRDVLFGGHPPEPAEEHMAPLRAAMKDTGAHIGLATDGDADRFGLMDADTTMVAPNHILALLLDYVVESRGWKLGTARSVATTHLLDAVARHHGVAVYQTPVGFKYVGELIKQDKIALGGEESAGLSIRGHVPEKDGILACLLAAEMVAARGATLGEQLRTLFKKVGAEFWPLRVNLRLSEELKQRTIERLRQDFTKFAGRKVTRTDRTDGAKLLFENGWWLLLRLSGTEPLLRLYTEADSPANAKRLADEAERWIHE
jgi:alpha-D-glucose phosphate-specific phosphoglucomutase